MGSGEAINGVYQEIIRPSERFYYQIPVDRIVTLAQQRDGHNQCQSNLEANMRTANGMLNAVNLALVHADLLSQYIDFTNTVWQNDKSIDDCPPIAPGADHFALLIAGHSRLQGKKNNAAKDGVPMSDTFIEAQVHEVDSVDRIIAIQVGENIHSSPPPDRAARAYAEAYQWELLRNPHLSKAEFSRRSGISAGALNDAILYSGLPSTVRGLTDNGALPFSVSVELSRALPWIAKDTIGRFGVINSTELSSKQAAKYDEILELELVRLIHRYNKDGNITNARAYIRAYAQTIKDRAKPVGAVQPELELMLSDQVSERHTWLKCEVETLMQETKNKHSMRSLRLQNMAIELFGLSSEFVIDPTDMQAPISLGKQALAGALGDQLDDDAAA